ncbi:MAG TPA: hypothetical protein VN366_00930 [Feifaniaceae bacterium]|nr:hypothetical protein [Feifaniaceae bacterium]
MEFMTPYPPLARAPLRMRGIFGIAWQLYKRGFLQMFLVSLLVVGLPMLLMFLPYFSTLNLLLPEVQSGLAPFGGSISPEFGLRQVGGMLWSMLLTGLVSLLVTFLFSPMYQGAVYLEMEERMEGRAGTLSQLFRYALPIGLKRFYTTFLAAFVLQIGVGVVTSLISSFGAFGALLSVLPSLIRSPDTAALTAASLPMGVVTVLSLLVALCAGVFMAFIYPVAAHEKKFAFSAVGRAFKLAAKHFWRILGATLLFSLAVGILSCILCLPALLLQQNAEAMFILLAVLLSVVSALVSPYSAAFQTALYVDIAARAEGPEFSVIDPDSVPDPDPDELRDGPRTL